MLFGGSRKKRQDEIERILGGMSDEPGPSSRRPYDTPPIWDPREAEQEYAPTAEPSAGPDKRKGMSPWAAAALGFIGGPGMAQAIGQRREREAQETAEEEQREQSRRLFETARGVIKDPDEWAAFQVDPKKWAETRLGDKYGFHDMAPGHTGAWGNPNRGGYTWRAPETINNGPDVVDYDGNSGQAHIAYQGKDDWTRYADSLGLQPGTPAYARAQQDFALRAQGPTAFQQQQAMLQQRQAGQQALRATPTYGQAHPQGGGGGRPKRPSQTRVVGGKTYWKIGGMWFDNPEGN